MRRAWSPAAEDKLRALYATTELPRLAFLLKRTPKAIRSRAKVLGITKGTKRAWTAAEHRILRKRYATDTADSIARDLGRTAGQVYRQAKRLGLSKAEGFAAQTTRNRWQQGRHENSRKALAGGRGWNKGIKGSTGTHPNCRKTQFRKGHLGGTAAERVQPIGALRIAEGQLQRKVNNDRPFMRRWVAVSRLVWEAANGPIPKGHIVRFRDGKQRTVEAEITADRLECVSLAENMRRNSYHNNYPKEVAKLIQLKGALTAKINRRSKAQ